MSEELNPLEPVIKKLIDKKKKEEKTSEVKKYNYKLGQLTSEEIIEPGKHYCGKDHSGKPIYV